MQKKYKGAIVCLGGGDAQVPFINAINEMGYYSIVVDRNNFVSGKDLAKEFINLSTHDKTKVEQEVCRIIQETKLKFCCVIARTTGKALHTHAYVSQRFAMDSLTQEVAILATEKGKLREFCEKHGLNFPAGVSSRDFDDLSGIKVPCVVKPDYTIKGKMNISLVETQGALEKAFENAKEISFNNKVEIESFIDGTDISVLTTYCNDKIEYPIHWDEVNKFDSKNYVCAVGLCAPSIFCDAGVLGPIKKYIERFYNSLEEKVSVPLAFSFKWDELEEKLYLIELHADLTGDFIAERLLPSCDPKFSFFESVINNQVEGKSFDFNPTNQILIHFEGNDAKKAKIEEFSDLSNDHPWKKKYLEICHV